MLPVENTQEENNTARDGVTKHAKGKKIQNPILLVIMILLILQVAMSGYQIYNGIVSEQQSAARQAALMNTVSKYTATMDGVTAQMLKDYKQEVYNNQNVNTLAKQQVLGTEYNFMAMMLVAKQNTKLLELITQIR